MLQGRYNLVSLGVIASILCCAFIGCVQPGKTDVTDVYKLQQSIVSHSPQARANDGLGQMTPSRNGLALLQPSGKTQHGKTIYALTLEQAISYALANNTDIAVVSYEPSISREQIIQAAAEFDYTIFGGYEYRNQDTSQRHYLFYDTANTHDFEFGVKQKTVTGAEVSLASTMTRSLNDGLVANMGPWKNNTLDFSMNQPLLRDAWPQVNLAKLNIARLSYKISMNEFSKKVQETVVNTMGTYYKLIESRHKVQVLIRLHKEAQDTYKKVAARHKMDATQVEIAQAESAIQLRYATLINAQKEAQDVQDEFVRLIGDDALNLTKKDIYIETLTQWAVLPVTIDPEDQMLTAIKFNPELEMARLAIEQGDIRVMVAKNQTLPKLDASFNATMDGGSPDSRSTAWNQMVDGRYVNYGVGIRFEYPIGNREREAVLREQKLRRRQDISRMQEAADAIALKINERIREVDKQYEEIVVRRLAVESVKKQLRALTGLEKIRKKMTPEFLNLKLNTQVTLADAEVQLLNSTLQYNIALLELAQATGTVMELNKVQIATPPVLERK